MHYHNLIIMLLLAYTWSPSLYDVQITLVPQTTLVTPNLQDDYLQFMCSSTFYIIYTTQPCIMYKMLSINKVLSATNRSELTDVIILSYRMEKKQNDTASIEYISVNK